MKVILATYMFTFCLSTYGFEILFPKRLKSDFNQAYLSDVILKSYDAIGVKAKIVYTSEDQINKRIKSGEFDAIASKVSLDSIVDNSIKIKPAIIKDYTVSRWRLKNNTISLQKISVGVIKGVRAYEKAILKNRSKFTKVKYFENYDDLLQNLAQGNIDSILLSPLAVNFTLDQEYKKNLFMIEDNLYQTSLSHYINTKHSKIQDAITKQFLKLDKEKKLDIIDFYQNSFKKALQKEGP